jgi:hypothetical protein
MVFHLSDIDPPITFSLPGNLDARLAEPRASARPIYSTSRKAGLKPRTRRSDISLIVLRRKVHSRVRLTNNDRWFFVQLYRWFPSILKVLTIIRRDTLVRWLRHYPTIADEYNFAFVRWTLDAIAILIVSSALFIGFVVVSVGLLHG